MTAPFKSAHTAHFRGIVERVTQCSGCLEVVVAGPRPGAFAIDNCCVWSIMAAEGSDWVGRPVEYAEGCLRFLDRPAALDESDQPHEPLSHRAPEI